MSQQLYKRALVTGGAGFIGSHLAKALIEEGLEVVILDNLSVGKIENVPEGAQFIEGDLLDNKSLRKAISNVDIVFHNAAKVSIRASLETFADDANNNIMGTLNLLKICNEASIRKLVSASSMAVYPDSPIAKSISEDSEAAPLTPYGISKLAGENYCLQLGRMMGFDVTILRYFNTYGIGQAFTPYVGVVTIFINRLLAGKSPKIFGDGKQIRDFVSVEDIVQANIKAMQYSHGWEVFNVGSGRGTSVYEIAQILIRELAPEIQAEFAAEHPGEVKNSVADISKISQFLHYQPKGVLEHDLREIATYYRSISQRKSG